MLHEFLAAHRSDLIDRCRIKVAARATPVATEDEIRFPGSGCVFTIELGRRQVANAKPLPAAI
ncbi:MAG TPA: hypothetical protein VFK48_02935 [Usitatibacter sp.]|nr:hypothetical protein [Usitatibacter sp.]